MLSRYTISGLVENEILEFYHFGRILPASNLNTKKIKLRED